MQQRLTEEDLAEHLRMLELATPEDRHELLTDLLIRVYPSKDNQNS